VLDAYGRTIRRFAKHRVVSLDDARRAAASTVPFESVEYDGFDRVTRSVDRAGGVTTHAYFEPRTTRTTLPRGNQTYTRVDWRGDVIETAQFDESWTVTGHTLFWRDGFGRVVLVSDGDGTRRGIARDTGGRVRRAELPHFYGNAPSSVEFCHDLDDQPVRAWTSEGRYIEIVRDGLGREVRATASSTMDDDALRRGATETVEFTSSYDDPSARGIGRPTRSTDASGALELSYDAFGRPRDIAYMPSAAARGPSTTLAARYTARFDYSPQGVLRAVSFLGLPQGFAVTYERDALGRPVAVRTTGGGDRSIVNPAFYDHEGRMTEAYLGNGSLTRWLYGTRSGRLDEIQHDYQQQRIESVRYEYDANSNITGESRTSEGRLTTEKTHRYDGSERLVQTQAWSVRGGRSTQVFEYSPGGNILRAGSTGEAYEYGNEAHPQAVTKITDDRGLDRELAYDRDGHLVRDVLQQGSRREDRRFSVDGAGCIQQAVAVVTDGTRTYENTTRTLCARDGRRTVRRTQNGLTGEVKTRIDFARLAEIRPEEGTFVLRVPVNGTTTAEEVRSLATGGRLEEKSGFLYADVRGSVLARTSFSAGNASVATYKTEDADYDPWGKTEHVSDRPLPAHQFVDHEPDPNLGLYDFGVRTYDPSLRRWLSPDPLFLLQPERGVRSHEELNLYQYARNSPVIAVDPSGTQAVPITAPVAAPAAGGPVAVIAVAIVVAIVAIKHKGDIRKAYDSVVGPTPTTANPGAIRSSGTPLTPPVRQEAKKDEAPPPETTTTATQPRTNGNSKGSTKPQHVYDINRVNPDGTKERHKSGISGSKPRADGKSPRAESQVRELNDEASADGEDVTYESEIVIQIPAGPRAREKALDLEKERVQEFYDQNGYAPPGNSRPVPKPKAQ
jgi:RHS repeat-associated protein